MLDKVCFFSWQTNTLVRMENYFLALWYSNYSHFKTSTKIMYSCNLFKHWINIYKEKICSRYLDSLNLYVHCQNISSYRIREVYIAFIFILHLLAKRSIFSCTCICIFRTSGNSFFMAMYSLVQASNPDKIK